MAGVAVSNNIHQKSPLDTLVRQSSRRAQVSPRLETPPRTGDRKRLDHSPTSPLLHTTFRSSAATASTSFIDFRNGEEDDTLTVARPHQSWTRSETESYYSSGPDSPTSNSGFQYIVDAVERQRTPPSPTPSTPSGVDPPNHLSWVSQESDATIQMKGYSDSHVRDTWRSSTNNIDPFAFRQYESPERPIPQVVVSSPTKSLPRDSTAEYHNIYPPEPPRVSRAVPSMTQYNVSNFSRPIRNNSVYDDQSKWKVLERNRSHTGTPSTPKAQQQGVQRGSPNNTNIPSFSPVPKNPQFSAATGNSPQYPLHPGQAVTTTSAPSPIIIHSSMPSAQTESAHPLSPSVVVSPPAQLQSDQGFHPDMSFTMESGHSASPDDSTNNTSNIRLPNAPPQLRPSSKLSLYSTYSYYQLDEESRTSSPSTPNTPNMSSGGHNATKMLSPTDTPQSRSGTSASSSNPSLMKGASIGSSELAAEDYLIRGIEHHENNRLTESARCFQLAATLNGGCGVGMLMWGLTLRHAWGTQKDEKTAFRWLRRAAEAAVGDLEAAREGKEQAAVKTELVLAIYEVGQCFLHGWGVAQDKKMAVSYYQVAARLGDADAQQELGYCLANGKGCKKNLKEAAKWYRAAAAQGASTVGLAWIYKSKYN